MRLKLGAQVVALAVVVGLLGLLVWKLVNQDQKQARKNARALVEEHGPFVEIHVTTSLEECARRDVNGLYAKAFAGEIKGFTGVDDPYEAPQNPEIVVDTEGLSPEESAAFVVSRLEELGLVSAKVTA